jgi:hypothetical protein
MTDSQLKSQLTTNTTSTDQVLSRSKNSISPEHASPKRTARYVEERKQKVARRAAGNQQCCRLPKPFRWKCFGIGMVLYLLVVGAILGSVLGVTLNKRGQQSEWILLCTLPLVRASYTLDPTDTTILNTIMNANSNSLITVTGKTHFLGLAFLFLPSGSFLSSNDNDCY